MYNGRAVIGVTFLFLSGVVPAMNEVVSWSLTIN
ncbi:hypothetical protein CPL00345_CDS0116 [Klebsiella phage GlastoCabaret]